MSNPDYTLVVLTAKEDWQIYHDIRRRELFEAKGHVGKYDPNHPDEYIPGNYPLLLKYNGEGIGVARLDVRNEIAVVRLVAVTKSEQGKGHGKVLGEMVEEFARSKGVKKLFLNADPGVIGYYDKLGYKREDWDPSELRGISANSIQMSKNLP